MRKTTSLQILKVLWVAAIMPMEVAQSQSCAIADSMVGPRVDSKAFYGRRYDPVSDTTILAGKGMINVPMLGLPTTVNLNTYWQGKVPTGAAKSQLIFSVSQSGKGPNMQNITKDEALYSDADAALLLLDDSIRIKLTRVAYKAHLDQGILGLMKQLIEDLTFDLSKEQLRQIGLARVGILRIGPSQLKINKELSASARETLRMYLCGTGNSSP